MSKQSEKTFGEKYTKGRNLAAYLDLIPSYQPGINDLLPSNINALLDTISTANSNAASKLSMLQTVQAERKDLFHGNAGLIKRCSQVRDCLASLTEGKKSGDFKRLQKIVQDLRGSKVKRKKAGTDGSSKTKSTSERSYASMCRQAKDALEIVKSNAAYTPGNVNITIANFTVFQDAVDAKNNEVAEKFVAYNNAIYERKELYLSLNDVVRKVKLALASQYGKQSNEYKDAVKF
jgi:hypothetical protein